MGWKSTFRITRRMAQSMLEDALEKIKDEDLENLLEQFSEMDGVCNISKIDNFQIVSIEEYSRDNE